jgi:uncharacterized protein
MQNPAEVEKLKHEILAVCEPELLFLLGVTSTHNRTETIFADHAITAPVTAQHFVLVLVSKSFDTTTNQLQDKIENKLQNFIATTALVLHTTQFVDWLLQGHTFAISVLEFARLLFRQDHCILPTPAQVNLEQEKTRKQMILRQVKEKVGEFIAGAELYHVRRQHAMATFMLHQATEQSLTAMLILHTGLKVNCHNLDKLIRYCSLFSCHIPQIFNSANEATKRQIALLQKAYIEARYNPVFKVCEADFLALLSKVEALQLALLTCLGSPSDKSSYPLTTCTF